MPNSFKVELSLGDLFEVHKLLANHVTNRDYVLDTVIERYAAGEEPASYHLEYLDEIRQALGLYERFTGGPYVGPIVAKLAEADAARLAFVPKTEEVDAE